jgi:peptidoglycan-associated lipoprotein
METNARFRLMTTFRIALSISMAALLASVAGCGDTPKPPPQTPADAPKTETPTAPVANRLPKDAPTSPNASAVRIAPEIAKACGITEPDAYFAFDSANLRNDDVKALALVATCFTSGPMKGKTLRVVGHTDPRGASEYNMSLGQSRADAVTAYTVSKGLDKSKAQSSTRGEMDAVGTDEPTWAKDRRVDLLLAP